MFEFLGCLGGCLVVLDWIIVGCKALYKFIKKYYKYKDAYEYLKEEEKDNKDNIKSMGFKTKKEQEEIEAKLKERRRA